MIIDSHCHFDFDVFDQRRDQVLQTAKQNGVAKIIVPGVRASSWNKLSNICGQYSECFPCYGLHPYFIRVTQLDLERGWSSPVYVDYKP